jgi:beta-glucosidase
MFALRRRRVAAATMTVVVLSLLAASGSSSADSGQPWQNRNQPPEVRADDLVAAMSTDQKIDLVTGNFAPVQTLGIPALVGDDGPDGLRSPGTTAMPSGQALAASFNRTLARAYGEVVGSEARGQGFNNWWGPAVDIARTPLAGRQPEAEGEDPFLAGNTAAQVILGAQSQHVISTLKHYAAYNQDHGRIGFASIGAPAVNVQVSERALQEIYETPFRIAVQQGGVDSVMCSYNQINGVPSCENPTTLGDLKRPGGLQGFVVPDFGFAVRNPTPAALAGVDLTQLPNAPAQIPDFTQIPASRLDDMAHRILFAMFDSGVFDNPVAPQTNPPPEVSTPQHQLLATQVAEAGTVLMKNDDGALPLSRHVHSIALIGPTGNDAVFVTGGSAGVPLAAGQAITPAQGIVARAAQAGVSVTTVQGSAGDVASPTLVDPAVLTPASGTGPGLLGQYWTNANFAGPASVTEVDQHVDATSPPITPAPPAWSAKWTGTLTPTASGLYRFTLSEAGIATLKIAGQTFGPAYREATQFIVGPSYVVNGAVQLVAGQRVPVEIDYSSASGLFSHEIHFGWQPPSSSGIPAAVNAARNADVAIVFANDAQGEGMDRYSLSLAGDQNQLIDAVAHANRHTIVVLNTGGAVLMPWLSEVSGVLEAWYPGQEFGAAIAAVLFGDASPGGRLPVTFPASENQGPAAADPPNTYPGDANGNDSYAEGLDVGYRWYDATGQRPLFPFGYGLSYENFAVSGVHAFYDARRGDAFVLARVTNTSRQAGPATVELFLQSPPAAQEPPKQLKGYTNVTLAPGQTRLVLFHLSSTDLGYYDAGAGRFAQAPGRYTVLLGTSSTDLDRRASFDVGGFGHGR